MCTCVCTNTAQCTCVQCTVCAPILHSALQGELIPTNQSPQRTSSNAKFPRKSELNRYMCEALLCVFLQSVQNTAENLINNNKNLKHRHRRNVTSHHSFDDSNFSNFYHYPHSPGSVKPLLEHLVTLKTQIEMLSITVNV